jgi:hypothetical protein
VTLLEGPEVVEALARELGFEVVDLGGVSNSRFAAKFGRSSSSAPPRLWDTALERCCEVVGWDCRGFLVLRYGLQLPGRAVEVGVVPDAAFAGRWGVL